MSDTNTTAAQGQDAGDEGIKFYDDKASADAAKPQQQGKKKLFEVSGNGRTRWCWANGYDHALASAARVDGYSASVAGKKEVTKDQVAAKLASFTDDELLALGLSRKPARGTRKTN